MQRFDGSVNFNRNWTEYRNGFEDKVRDEYWLGNERVHRMTSNNSSRNESYSLRIELYTNGSWYFANYENFCLDSEVNKYAIHISGFNGSAGDALTNPRVRPAWYHGGMKFSTPDSDNDKSETRNCAREFQAGWWFNSCWDSCLTCPYGGKSFNWQGLSHLNSLGDLKAARMMTMMMKRNSTETE